MKLLIILMALSFIGCASSPKILMKNCTKVHDDYYECEEIPQKTRSFDRR